MDIIKLFQNSKDIDPCAAGETIFKAVDERRFLFLVRETPFFAMHVMRVLAERIQRKEAEAGQA